MFDSWMTFDFKICFLNSILVLKLIKDSQQQHGLRHADYQRYRGYCTRRVRRLRKVLKLPQVLRSIYPIFC